jgi:hypothetical protein
VVETFGFDARNRQAGVFTAAEFASNDVLPTLTSVKRPTMAIQLADFS